MQDLVRVSVADPAEEVRVGQGALERVRLPAQRGVERGVVGLEHLESARVEPSQPVLAAHHVQRGPLLRSGLGEQQRTLFEVERGQAQTARDLGPRRLPVQPPGDHQVEYQAVPVLELEHNCGCANNLVVLVIAQGTLVDAVAMKELGGFTGVFAGDQIHLFQDAQGAQGNVFQVSDWGGDKVKAAPIGVVARCGVENSVSRHGIEGPPSDHIPGWDSTVPCWMPLVPGRGTRGKGGKGSRGGRGSKGARRVLW